MQVTMRRKKTVEPEQPGVILGAPAGGQPIQVDTVQLKQVAPNMSAPSLAATQMASKSLLDQAQRPLAQPGAEKPTPTGPTAQNALPDATLQPAASGSILNRINKPARLAQKAQANAQRRIAQ